MLPSLLFTLRVRSSSTLCVTIHDSIMCELHQLNNLTVVFHCGVFCQAFLFHKNTFGCNCTQKNEQFSNTCSGNLLFENMTPKIYQRH